LGQAGPTNSDMEPTAVIQTMLFRKIYKHGVFHRHIQSVATITNETVMLENYDDKGNKTVNILWISLAVV
jgi:hypothetical protein